MNAFWSILPAFSDAHVRLVVPAAKRDWFVTIAKAVRVAHKSPTPVAGGQLAFEVREVDVEALDRGARARAARRGLGAARFG